MLDSTIDEKARKKFFKNAWIRVKGGFDSSKYTALLQEIDNDIAKISQLTSSALELEPIRAEKKSRLQSTHWKNIRDQAQRLFDSLNSRFHPCSCHQSHQAKLRLDARISYDAGEDFIKFRFIMMFESDPSKSQTFPYKWRDIEIETTECNDVLYVYRVQPPQLKVLLYTDDEIGH
jgi:hypothetical protein